MFIEVLFIIAKKWKRPKYLSTDEWKNKMWQVYTMQCCSIVERNEVLLHGTTCMNLKTCKRNKS